MKQCCKCRQLKQLSEFRPDKRNHSGVGSQCVLCCREYDRSDKKKLLRRLYRQTSEGKEAYKRFSHSINGRIANAQCARRRRERSKYDIQLTTDDIRNIYLKYGNRCFKCNTLQNLTIDHHYPLSKGYLLSFDNAVVLCKSCNSRKSTKLPEEFYSLDELVRLASIRFSVL